MRQEVGKLQQFFIIIFPFDLSSAFLKQPTLTPMFSQQQIYDSPQQPTQHPPPTINPNQRTSIKKALIQAYQILCNPSPVQTALTQCHKIISDYMKEPQILQIMFQLIIQFSQTNQTLTKLVITQIFAYMKKQSSFGYGQKHEKGMINELFLGFFVQSNVDFKFKKMLQNSYMHFIYLSQCVKLREYTVNFIDKKLTQIFSSTKQSLQALQQYNRIASPISLMIPPEDIMDDNNLKVCSSIIHILRALFQGGNLQIELLKYVLPHCFSVYYLAILSTVKAIFYAVEMKNQLQFAAKVDECAKFSELYVQMYSKLDTGKFPQLRQRILHTREIYRLLTIMLGISPQFTAFTQLKAMLSQNLYPQGKQTSFSVLSFQIQQHINFLELQKTFLNSGTLPQPIDLKSKRIVLNLKSIKKNAIQILIKCVKAIGKKQAKTFTTYPYLSAIVTGLWLKVKDCLFVQTEIYLKSVEKLSKQGQLAQIKRQQQDFLNSSIRFLSSCVKLPCMYTMVSPYQNQILFKICFPWLISRNQHQRFQGSQYLFFREDLVNKQNMSYIENTIGSLIQAYMDNIDGVVTGIMQNCLQLIEYHLTRDQKVLEGLIPEVRQSWVFEVYAPERQIQSALTLIAVQSYLSLQRNDITLILQKFISTHKAFFLSVENDYRIIVQFLMMYSYYVDNFYSNTIQGVSSQTFEYRQLHQQVLKYCCYLMKANYNYEKNKYKGRTGSIVYFAALDCLNNSLNHSELVYALYCHFPLKHDLAIPHYMLPYENYPFYPRKGSNVHSRDSLKKIPGELKMGNRQSFLNPAQRKARHQEQVQQQMRQLLMHYRKMGLNRDQYFQKDQLIAIIQFLSQNLQSKANIKIIQLLIQINLVMLKQQLSIDGMVINIPCIFRDDIATQLALRVYTLMHSKPQQFPNRGLFEIKATELLYVLHTISSDAYYIYSLGMDIVWMNPGFWNFSPTEDDNNIERLLKCTDLVVRLALKHYSSEKGVNIKELMEKIVANFTLYSYMYIKKMRKFNVVFGILLNLILLKVSPERIFDFLYLLITEKLIKAELRSDVDSDSQEESSNKQEIPSSCASDLISLSFYLFLTNIYRNPDCLNSQKNFQLLKVFHEYLTHYVNAHQIVTQLGDVFGKVFACCLCIVQKQFLKDTLNQFDHNIIEFFWRNLLYSGKVYKTDLQMRIVAIKLLNILSQVVNRNYTGFSIDRLQQMYQTACSCVFYSQNRQILMMNDDDIGEQDDFDHAGQQQEWENQPITLARNDTGMYVQDDVLLLKKVSRQLLESQNTQKKQWMTKLIEDLPGAVRNFVKNKVINYQQETKELGLRKILKVKRPEGYGGSSSSKNGATTKQEIIKENVMENKKKKDEEDSEGED